MTAPTPPQTIGPFFHEALVPGPSPQVPAQPETAVTLTGRVLDGAGEPVTDALVEAWAGAVLGHAIVRGATDDEGRYQLVCSLASSTRYMELSIFGRGILRRLATRAYLVEAAELESDPELTAVPESRRATLIARPEGPRRWTFDIHIQASQETVFFHV